MLLPGNDKAILSALYKLTAVLCGTLLALFLLELSLRTAGFVALTYREHSNRLKIKEKGNCVILCLGESTTFREYPQLLEKMLNEKSVGIGFKVIDEGVPGQNTDDIINALGGNLDRYHPDIVIAMMGINDDGRTMPYSSDLFWDSYKTVRLFKLMNSRIASMDKKSAVRMENSGGAWYKRPDSNAEIFMRYLSKGELRKAREFNENCEKALNDDEKLKYYIHTCWYLSAAYKQELDKPIKYIASLLNKYPQVQWLYKCLGELYAFENDFVSAGRIYAEGLKHFPDDDRLAGELAEVYRELGKKEESSGLTAKVGEAHLASFNSMTKNNVIKLIENTKSRGIRLILMQYPRRSVESLRRLAGYEQDGIIFVENKDNFDKAIERHGYWDLFRDTFAGDFGHCTEKGNILIAENLAETIFKIKI